MKWFDMLMLCYVLLCFGMRFHVSKCYDAVWRDTIGYLWYGMIRRDLLWYGVLWQDMALHGMMSYGVVGCNMVQYDMLLSGTVGYGTIRHNTVF